jgi:hypothetical protein
MVPVIVAQDPAGKLKPPKDKSTERMDAIVAIFMAIRRAMRLPRARTPPRCAFWDSNKTPVTARQPGPHAQRPAHVRVKTRPHRQAIPPPTLSSHQSG